jgi:hypothetical protein
VNNMVAEDLENTLAGENNKYIDRNSHRFIAGDSVEIAGMITLFHTSIIDSLLLLNEEEISTCADAYKNTLINRSALLLGKYFEDRRLKESIRSAVNEIIAHKQQDLIELLFLNYSIAQDAEVLQFEENGTAPHKWGSLKQFLNGIAINGLNAHIKFKQINLITWSKSDNNITSIGFINHQ